MLHSSRFKSFVVICSLIGLASCAGAPSHEQAAQKASGPAILGTQVNTPVVLTTPDLKRLDAPNVIANVKDETAKIDSVTLRVSLAPVNDRGKDQAGIAASFEKPLDIPMQHLAGTTWAATLSDDALKMLAVNGREVTYVGQIVAANDKGVVSIGPPEVEFTIRAPEMYQAG